MSSIASVGTTQNNPNFLGTLLEIGQNETPFLVMLGGLGGAKPVVGVNFALNSNYALNSASQPSISEDDSITGATVSTYAKGQDENAVQIFQRKAEVSYANQSDSSTLSGVPNWAGNMDGSDAMSQQVEINLRQLAVDLNYTLLNGSYTKWSSSSTAAQSRGLSTAISSNTVDGGAASLTKDMFNTLVKKMVDAGAKLAGAVILVNSTYKQELSSLFALQERSSVIGGVAVDIIATDFGNLAVVYEPSVLQTEIVIADMSKLQLAVLPTRGQPLLVEATAKVGASDTTQIYGQFGLDYANEIFHGKIFNLA